MRSRAIVLTLIASIAACGSDKSPAASGGLDAGTPSSSSSSSAGGPITPPPPGPPGKGDPCRGQPIPDDQHYAPPGMCTRLVATGVASLRQISFASNGDLFGVGADGTIWLLRDDDGDGFYGKTEIHNWGVTDGNGNNAHIDEQSGFVYAGSNEGVKRFAYDPKSLTGGPAEDVITDQPQGGSHPKHTTHVFDGFLYVHSGSSANAAHESGSGQTDYDTKRGVIKRFDLSKFTPGTPFKWDAGEVFTQGLRNGSGFTRNAITKKIYDVVNGLDDQQYKGVPVTNDNPGEQVVELASGKKYGYPFCFTAQRIVDNGNLIPVGTQVVSLGPNSYPGNPHDDAWCAQNSERPATFIQAHSAPLDITFFDTQPSGALPEKYRGGAFIALHGSWDRDPPTGYKVVWQPFNADGSAPNPTSTNDTTTFPYETVFGGGKVATGPVEGAWAWSDQGQGESVRPVGVAVGPIDGALYISTDAAAGNVYRIGLTQK